MATFEFAESSRSQATASSLPRHPLRRFEPTLRKFQVALPADLGRLQQHKINMEKFSRSQAWHELDREQINAARTVQQLKAHIRELESIRSQVQVSDLPEFDERVKLIQDDVIASVSSFRELQQMYSRESQAKGPQRNPQNLENQFAYSNDRLSGRDAQELITDQQQVQFQLVLDEDAVASWDTLKEGLAELNELIHDFSAMVHEQQESIDTIESNIEQAQVNVEQGVSQLGMASKLKAASYPLIGAAVGGICGGPVGLVVGLKAGAAVAVGGGLVGFLGGKFLKRKREEVTEMQLENLSSRKELKKHQ